MVGFLIESEWDIAITGVLRDKYVMPDFVTMPTLSNFISMLIATWRKTRYYALPNASSLIMEKHPYYGSTGIGKSYLASPLAIRHVHLAIRYITQMRLNSFSKLKMTKADGSYIREISRSKSRICLYLMTSGSSHLIIRVDQHYGNYRRQTWKAIHDYYFTITCKGMV